MTIPHKRIKSAPIGGKTGLQAKLYPNGEITIYKPRTFVQDPLPKDWKYDTAGLWCACMRAYGTVAPALAAGLVPLGSSTHPIFNRSSETQSERDSVMGSPRTRKGLKGITARGSKIVRNAAYLLQKTATRQRCVFATCTVPSLEIEQMEVIHQNFAQVVRIYRRSLTRILQANGLSGKSVTVVEVQEKRYERTGQPVMHIHTVFCGKTGAGRWAVTIEDHDAIWSHALSSVIRKKLPKCSCACNLQRVKKSAESYLGKYLTKGTSVVSKIVADGFIGWLPKHWYFCTRELRRDIDRNTRRVDSMAYWLNDIAELKSAQVWMWHRDVVLEMNDGHKITIARYGKLLPAMNNSLHEYFASQ